MHPHRNGGNTRAHVVTEPAVELDQEESVPARPGSPRFTSETAREAGRKGGAVMRARAQERRAREAEGAEPAGMAASATVARSDAAVVQKLQAKAEKGDVAAARELREWRRRDPAADASADAVRLGVLITALPTTTRAWLVDRLVEAQELPAQEHIREGSDHVDQSLPASHASVAEEQEAEGHPREASESRAGVPSESPDG
jgi:hypothetical protein